MLKLTYIDPRGKEKRIQVIKVVTQKQCREKKYEESQHSSKTLMYKGLKVVQSIKSS